MGSTVIKLAIIAGALLLGVSLFSQQAKDDAAKWESTLSNGVTFGFQGDPHSYGRLPPKYMRSVLKDLPQVKADFSVVIGDIDADELNGYRCMEITKRSEVPVFFAYGNHDQFKEWSFVFAKGIVPDRRSSGRINDPFNFMRAASSIWQGWTSLPYCWSMNYKGVHFVYAPGCEFVQPSWFLKWLEKDLEENKELTTVVFLHTGIFENSDSMTANRRIIERNPQVKLICYAHYHYPREIIMVGDAQVIDAELPPEANRKESMRDGYYGVASVASDGIRVWARYFESGAMTLVSERKIPTTFNAGAPASVSLPYLMTKGNACNVPVLKLKKPKLRLWGVEKEELIPNPFCEKEETPWQPVNGVSLAVSDDGVEDLGLPRMTRVKLNNVRGTNKHPAKLARMTLDRNIRFPKEESDPNAGVYDFLLLVKSPTAPLGRNVWFVVDAIKPDGEIEATYTCKILISKGGGALHYNMLHILGCPFHKGFGWAWLPGPKGKEEIFEVHVDKPREANKFEISLATPDEIQDEEWQVSLFGFNDYFYTLSPYGVSHTQNLEVRLAGEAYEANELNVGQRKEWDLKDILGGARLEIAKCDGSRLALVELKGGIDALQLHQIRKVKELSPDEYELEGLCEGVPPAYTAVGVTAVDILGKGLVNSNSVGPKAKNHCLVKDGAKIRIEK